LLTLGKEATKEHLPPAEKKSHDSAGSLKISEIIPAGGKEPSGLDTLITFSNTYSMTGSDGSSTAEIGSINEKDTALLNKILQSPESLQQLPPDTKFYYGPAADLSKRKGAKIFHLYAIRTGGNEIAVLQNRDIESAKQDYDLSGRPEINFRFSPTGARKWAQMTRANIGRYIAILLDHSVITAPRVNQAIEGGISSISGAFTVEEARMLAAQLNSGAIPANLHIIKQDVIAESTGNKGKLLLIVLATFVVASGFAWFVFNTLKNR
jgi:SecD/SecF fusion protein